MDILFGDPFYHNIIHHISWTDLYNLKSVCTHYNTHITKTHIKHATIKIIKEKLHTLTSKNYNRFKKTMIKMDRLATFLLYVSSRLDKYNK